MGIKNSSTLLSKGNVHRILVLAILNDHAGSSTEEKASPLDT